MALPPDQKEMLYHAAAHRHGMICFKAGISEGETAIPLHERVKQIFDTTD